MKENRNRFFVGVAVVAWSQFLVLVESLPREEAFSIHVWREFINALDLSIFPWASLAFLFNIAAIILLASSCLLHFVTGENLKHSKESYLRAAGGLSLAGLICWKYSFISLLMSYSGWVGAFAFLLFYVCCYVLNWQDERKAFASLFCSLLLLPRVYLADIPPVWRYLRIPAVLRKR